jgi:hypothetical protein
MLLEYFLPEMFRTLALDAAGHEGHSPVLATLEAETRRASGAAPEGAGARAEAAQTSMFAAQAAAMRTNERFLAWLRADPPLAAVDLRPYVYFASERYALPVGVAQRLSPAGARALENLRSNSEAMQRAGAEVTAGLPLPEVTAIIGELTVYARSGRAQLDDRASPLTAMTEIAKRRPEVGSDVIAAILGVPYETLPANTAILVNGLGAVGNLRDAVDQALQTMAAQTRNEALKQAADSRLRAPRAAAPKSAG